MADKFLSKENLKFTLYDVHQLEDLFLQPYFSEHSRESVDLMLEAAIDFSNKELFPYLEEMDREGIRFKDGEVEIHPQVYKVLRELGESGWIIATLSNEEGGMQLPHMLYYITSFIYNAANNSAIGYTGLTGGAANLIRSFGSDGLKDKYGAKMYQGKWQGTMALTEPQAGSSLSDLTTNAVPLSDGSYKITGQKVFISGGDYKDVENVVHLMLARIEGAPPGTRGISLFVVPKKRVIEDNNLVENDVITAGVYHKMGQHGYVTTHLMIGENDNCIGDLVGEANLGLKYMFQMMNDSRIVVGLSGASIASAAYYAALEYAMERTQGRNPSSKNAEESPIEIINHADVRRMLFLQKAVVEGSLSLIIECAKYIDLIKVTNGEEKENLELLLELLTPIVKVYPTEMGIVAVNNGLQCLGGYGYCIDFPLEQLSRDIRITTLYEGTTGIQSLDLLGRKMLMQDGKAAKLLWIEINKTITEANHFEGMIKYSNQLQEALTKFQTIVQKLTAIAIQGKTEEFLADANLFMELSGIIVIGWQWLKQGTAACKNLELEQSDFLESKIQTMKYFFTYELPKIEGLMITLMEDENITIKGDKELLI